MLLCVSICLPSLTVAQWKVASEVVPLAGQTCGVDQTANVWYPADGQQPGKYPLVAFSHGLDAGGPLTGQFYGALLSGLASKGYVVIAPDAGTADLCLTESADQLLGLAFAWNTWKGKSRIDKSKKVGIMGHSMGGGAT